MRSRARDIDNWRTAKTNMIYAWKRARYTATALLATYATFVAIIPHLHGDSFKSSLGDSNSSEVSSIELYFAPKPHFHEVPRNLVAWLNELKKIGGGVVLLLNELEDIEIAVNSGFKTAPVQEVDGLPTLSSMLTTTARFSSSAVGFANSDILPDAGTGSVLKRLLTMDTTSLRMYVTDSKLRQYEIKREPRDWLYVASRRDYESVATESHVHMEGGVDFWLWNVHRTHDILGVRERIPPFRLGRPWFDNWLTATAMQVGGRLVLDATQVLNLYHKSHVRVGNRPDWSDMKFFESDKAWNANKMAATKRIPTFRGTWSYYVLGIGTTCEAPYFLVNDASGLPQFQRRNVSLACPACLDCYKKEIHESAFEYTIHHEV